MSTALAQRDGNAEMLERVVMQGDLAALSPQQRIAYYQQVCESVGLNPLTRPFDYLKLSGRLVLYAKKDATDQLRAKHRVSVQLVQRQFKEGLYIVTARATLPDGRYEEEDGVVAIRGLQGEALANAMLKAVTKAKRRVTLSVCGLGWLDESEVESIPAAQHVQVAESGEIVGHADDAVRHGFPPTPPDDEDEPPHYQETQRTYAPAPGEGPPATPKQLQTIQRMARALGKPLPAENLTRAQASEIISALIGEMDERGSR